MTIIKMDMDNKFNELFVILKLPDFIIRAVVYFQLSKKAY
ncbi:protein of unknown function [Xenorhabdus poinarii G6]|uniref:Uncharacterized protein n=1 Tax=Xenorhabdus poinarii G6 TaxID=1354304 RepID=A0A068R5S5_9GAMM|nr:protein of unknown function [Xenorhabdus poinarii G6]